MGLQRKASAALISLLLAAVTPIPFVSFAHAEATVATEEARENNRRIVSEAFDRWQAGTGNFFDDVLAADVVWTIEGSGPNSGEFRGQRALMDRAVVPFTLRLEAPVRPVSKRIWSDGDHVIVNWKGETTALDGQPYQNDYAWIMRMEKGKAVEVTAFLDLAPFDDVFRRIPAPQEQ